MTSQRNARTPNRRLIGTVCVLCAFVVAFASLLAYAADRSTKTRPGRAGSKKPTRQLGLPSFNFFGSAVKQVTDAVGITGDKVDDPVDENLDEDLDEGAVSQPIEVDINDDNSPPKKESESTDQIRIIPRDDATRGSAVKRETKTTLGAGAASGQDSSAEIWIEWGAGIERRWQGKITISQGKLTGIRPYGFAIDSPGSAYLNGGVVEIKQRRPSAYDSAKLTVDAPISSTLRIELTPTDQPENVKVVQLPLRSVLGEIHRTMLDKQGNQLIVRRAPGDALRVKFQRDTLIFQPQEYFEFQVEPHLIPVEPDAPYRCRVDFLEARTGSRINTFERQIQSSAEGTLPAIKPFNLKVPSDEGAYDVAINFTRKQTTSPLSKNSWDHQRKIQLVVVNGQPDSNWSIPGIGGGQRSSPWEEIIEINPAIVMDQTSTPGSFNPFSIFGGTKGQTPAVGGKVRSRRLLEEMVVELGIGSWQAIPLKVRTPGEPHHVEIRIPGDVDQKLGMRILELGEGNAYDDAGLDTGVVTRRNAPDGSVEFKTHRLTFWPRTKRPILLMTNRARKSSAMYGTIRIFAGPEKLPKSPKKPNAKERVFAAVYNQPDFAKSFGAADAFDQNSGRVLKDWDTYYRSADRLVQYLHHVGYNSAVICVARDGGAIYPSDILQPTPRYDDGVFFSTGQDAVPKDVLEMLLRMFDRAGLKLIPALKFSAPLPELEQQIRGRNATGIELVNFEGKKWIDAPGTKDGSGAYYNPLDPRVQRAIENVVEELLDRYGHHESFGGVTLQFGGNTYVQMPDHQWGADDTTLAHFSSDEHRAGRDPFSEGITESELRTRWMQWRARELADWYKKVGQIVVAAKPTANFYLSEIDPMRFVEAGDEKIVNIEHKLNLRGSLLRMGIEPEQLVDSSHVILLRTSNKQPSKSNAFDLRLATEFQADEIFATGSVTRVKTSRGSMLVLPTSGFELPSPPAKGSESNSAPIRLSTQFSMMGVDQRQQFVHDLAISDSQMLSAGGRMAMFGQEDALQEFIATYRSLPPLRFQTVGPERLVGQPVVTRTLSHNGETIMYVVNDSPWPTTASYTLSPGNYKTRSLGSREVPEASVAEGTRRWAIKLEPYDFVAVAMSSPKVRVLRWQAVVDRDVVEALNRSVDEISDRLEQRHGPAKAVLKNGRFESINRSNLVTGWKYSTGAGITVRLDSENRRGGNHSLYLRSTPPTNWTNGPVVWVRSSTFPAPPSGRMAILAWMKTSDTSRQPRVRMLLEGTNADGQFLRTREFGASDQDRRAVPLKEEWSPVLFAIGDLPREGLKDLRIGFDLRGTGDVWIDELEVYDVWLNNSEYNEMAKRIERARQNLEAGQLNDCQTLLNSYWAQSLRLMIPPVQRRPQQVASKPRPVKSTTPVPPKRTFPTAPKQKPSERFVPNDLRPQQKAVPKPNPTPKPNPAPPPKPEPKRPVAKKPDNSTRPIQLQQPASVRPHPPTVAPPTPIVQDPPRSARPKPTEKPTPRVAERLFRLPPVLDEGQEVGRTVVADPKRPANDPSIGTETQAPQEKESGSWLDSVGGAVKKVFSPITPRPAETKPKRVRKSLFGGSSDDE